MANDDKTDYLKRFFDFIDQPQFHSTAEVEYFERSITTIYHKADELVKMIFVTKEVEREAFIKLRNKLLDALKCDFLIKIEQPNQGKPQTGSKVYVSRFEESLNKCKGGLK